MKPMTFKALVTLLTLLLSLNLSGPLFGVEEKPLETGQGYVEDVEGLMENFEYVIGPEDVLEIYVWQHPDLSITAMVRPDGKISFPILDDIEAEGLTPKELDNSITQNLKEFIREPQVTVMMKNLSSKKICVLGEVEKPGIYPISGRLTVIEAIAEARYLRNSAVLDSIIVIRPKKKGKSEIMRIDAKKILAGEIEENILLKPDDVVFVPKSFISKLNDFLEFFTSKINPSLQAHFTKIY